MSKKPETVYAKVDEQFDKQLWQVLSKRASVKQIAEQLRLKVKQVYKWKEGEALYPLSSLQSICQLTGLKPIIEYIRTKEGIVPLFNPKIENQLTPELSEFFGHLLHDGGIDIGYGVHYTTDEKPMLNRFQKLVELCFGTTQIRSKASGAATTIYYPAILGRLLVRNFGLPKGSKIKSNVRVPSDLKRRMTKVSLIVPYIAAAYCCDGDSKRNTRIGLASRSLEKPSQLLLDFQDLLRRLDFRSSVIRGSTIYETQDGIHRNWVLSFRDPSEGRRFRRIVQDYRSAFIC